MKRRFQRGLEVRQVYGWFLCPRTGRVLVQDDEGAFNLPGGTPEEWDADLTATLVREAFEENQVRVGETAHLGYQEVHRPDRAPYAQARMAGVVEAFAERAPDPNGGRVYRRLMTSLETAPAVLGWGEPAVLQAWAAARVARARWHRFARLSAGPGTREGGLVTPGRRWAGAALHDGTTIAHLATRERTSGADELGVIAHGPDSSKRAAHIAGLLHQWKRGRPPVPRPRRCALTWSATSSRPATACPAASRKLCERFPGMCSCPPPPSRRHTPIRP